MHNVSMGTIVKTLVVDREGWTRLKIKGVLVGTIVKTLVIDLEGWKCFIDALFSRGNEL